MGLPSFVKVLKYGCLVVFGLAAVLAAIVALSSPATARPGGGGDVSLKSWDTDNLRFTVGSRNYNFKSFNVPSHEYGGYSGVAACQSGVADGFFQTDNSVVNDFPRLVQSGTGDNVRWELAGGSANNDAGCDTFAAQQDRLAAQVASGAKYAFDEDGNIVDAPSGDAFTTARGASGWDRNYVRWSAKASSGYSVQDVGVFSSVGMTSDVVYLKRVDGYPLRPGVLLLFILLQRHGLCRRAQRKEENSGLRGMTRNLGAVLL